jgi:diguanylate cyclase (GGDEF)-like protein
VGTRTSNRSRGAPACRQRPLRIDDVGHGSAIADPAELQRLLAATELRLRAALRQIELMRRRDALLQREVVRMTKAALRARRFAYYDELTGLPNRRLLLNRFEQAVALASRRNHQLALVFLDVDRFKHVNDALGHGAGDKLLQQLAARLAAGVRASDTACRCGGDEFVVLLPEINGRKAADAVANGIRAQLAPPYLIDGAAVTVTVSIGVAVHPVDAMGYADLARLADVAMYRNKARSPVAPGVLDWPLDNRNNGGLVPLLAGPAAGPRATRDRAGRSRANGRGPSTARRTPAPGR